MAYLTADVAVGTSGLSDLDGVLLDCMGHEVSLSVRPFRSLNAFQIRNCRFRLGSQLAIRIEASELTNVTFEAIQETMMCVQLLSSLLVGVRFTAIGSLAEEVEDTIFIGSSFS